MRMCLPAQRRTLQKSLRALHLWRTDLWTKAHKHSDWDPEFLIYLVAHSVFEEMGWQTVHSFDLRDWLLPFVLDRRRGSPLVTLIILQNLLEQFNFRVSPLSIQNPSYARITHSGWTYYLDLNNPLTKLHENELLAILPEEPLPEPFCLNTFYLEECLAHLTDTGNDTLALEVVNYLCEAFPRRMDYVAQRAMLKHRNGAMPSALRDLKRFFTFYSEKKAPRDLVKIYRKLSSHLTK